jgi:hypothetical protein
MISVMAARRMKYLEKLCKENETFGKTHLHDAWPVLNYIECMFNKLRITS